MIKEIEQKDFTIAEGDKGIYETVNYMWHYALRDSQEPEVKELVKSLTKVNKLDTLKNIYNWVTNNISYKLDPPDREMITAPIHFVNGNLNAGDCDCMTTLLVCLLETAGFESAITVIAWRDWSYTHVYAEVKYNGKWYVLDPTLGNAGFGRQDKKIIRDKRITKKDMGKLTVLADKPKKLRRCNGSHCRNRDDNENVNNININFGTTVEGSYNYENQDFQTNTAKPVSILPIPYNHLPKRHQDAQKITRTAKPTILKPISNGGYERDTGNRKQETGTNNTDFSFQNPDTKIQVITSEKPKTVINFKPRTKQDYIEFP